jgi:2-polyprenyl-6-methoxyphenol hydroxylase-like FAD-dependent oxidoreductase
VTGHQETTVAIVGGGPVGLLAGCLLAIRGVDCVIVDDNGARNQHSRATTIWPRVLELTEHLGVAERLIQAGHPLRRMTYYSDHSKLASIDFGPLSRETPYPFAIGLPQNTTEDVLRERYYELGGAIIPAHATDIVARADESVDIAGIDHDGNQLHINARWVIGADGVRSIVREVAHIPLLGSGDPVHFAICDAAVDHPDEHDEMAYCWSPGGTLGMGPVLPDTFRLAVRVPDAKFVPSPEFFQDALNDRAALPIPNITTIKFMSVFAARVRWAETFQKGRAFLTGDAAHQMIPAGGQGMNTGLMDALGLCWRLALVARGSANASILTGYSEERLFALDQILDGVVSQVRQGAARTATTIQQRDESLRALAQDDEKSLAFARRLTQLSISYPSKDGVLQGSRLPVIPSYRDKDDQFLTVSPDACTEFVWNPDKVEQPNGMAVSIQQHPELTAFLGKQPMKIVVRPDGYIESTAAL